MPFPFKNIEEVRMRFVTAAYEGHHTMTDLCAGFRISRKTGYKWLCRFDEEGVAGLADRSSRPHHSPQRLEDDLVAVITGLAGRYRWGAKKIRTYLEREQIGTRLPALSSISDILAREGISTPRRRRRRVPLQTRSCVEAHSPGDVWTADFKGWFTTRDGQKCEPFTLCDAHSRYLVACKHVPSTSYDPVHAILTRAFKTHGVPKALRTDNGPPFAAPGRTGLTRLSIWLIDLGVIPDRIRPGRPQQNGRHERMHRTLKREAISPPAQTVKAQQKKFDRFRHIYNTKRPHEALDGRTPQDCFGPCERPFPKTPKQPDYDQTVITRSVRHNGEIKWRGNCLYLTEQLAGRHVALRESQHGTLVSYGPIDIAMIDEVTNKVYPVCKPNKKQQPNV